MNLWLMKSEPDVFGLDQLQTMQVSPWDGVRNYQARNNLQAMQLGDRFLFYHSSCDPSGVVGEGEIARTAYPDHTAWDATSPYFDAKSTPDAPRWFMVDVRFRERYPRLVSLQELRRVPQLADMVLLNNSRLSVQPVSAAEFQLIRAMAHVLDTDQDPRPAATAHTVGRRTAGKASQASTAAQTRTRLASVRVKSVGVTSVRGARKPGSRHA